jgi:hypothetical protein
MAQQFFVLLNNGMIQPFTFDSTIPGGNLGAIQLGTPIVPAIGHLGLTLSSFKVDAAANEFVGVASPTSGGSCTAFAFDMNGTPGNNITIGGVSARGVALTPNENAWITSNRGAFLWSALGDEFCAVAPQGAQYADATVGRPCYEQGYLVYGAQKKLVVHDVQNGETYAISARRCGLAEVLPDGNNANLVVSGVHKISVTENGSPVVVLLILWTSSGAIGGQPNRFKTGVLSCRFTDLVLAAKRGGEVTPFGVVADVDGQSWGVASTDPTLEFIVAGQPRGSFRRFEYKLNASPPPLMTWQPTHEYFLDDYLTSPMSSNDIKFLDDGVLL